MSGVQVTGAWPGVRGRAWRLTLMGKKQIWRVLLVRTGCTDWDLQHRAAGRADLPLCLTARAELARLAESAEGVLGADRPDVLLSGPDEASGETCAFLAERWSCRSKPVDALAEVGLGLWEGLRSDELAERYPSVYARWREDPSSITTPEGEHIAEAADRLMDALFRAVDKLRTDQPNVGLVLRPIAHAVVRCRAMGEPLSAVWRVSAAAPVAEAHSMSREGLLEGRAGAAPAV